MVYELEKSRKQTNPPTCKVIKASSRLFAYDANRCLTFVHLHVGRASHEERNGQRVLHPWNLLEWRMSSFPDAQSHPWTLLVTKPPTAMNHNEPLIFSSSFQANVFNIEWVLGFWASALADFSCFHSPRSPNTWNCPEVWLHVSMAPQTFATAKPNTCSWVSKHS